MSSNLPPGVTVSMIPGNRPEDVLAEAIAEGWRPRCSKCGAFLRLGQCEYREYRDSAGVLIGVEYKTCAKCGHENIEWSYPVEP